MKLFRSILYVLIILYILCNVYAFLFGKTWFVAPFVWF